MDSFYVLEGELEFTVHARPVRARAGSFVLVPPHVVHAFTNPGRTRARFLDVHAPDCGFVEYLRATVRGEEPDGTAHDIHDVRRSG